MHLFELCQRSQLEIVRLIMAEGQDGRLSKERGNCTL